MKVPKKVKTPKNGIPTYLSLNKTYKIINSIGSIKQSNFSSILSDGGDILIIKLTKCAFLNGQDWIVTEWQEIN